MGRYPLRRLMDQYCASIIDAEMQAKLQEEREEWLRKRRIEVGWNLILGSGVSPVDCVCSVGSDGLDWVR